MKTALMGCLLVALVAVPALAQPTPNDQASKTMNCPMMSDQMQKQMSAMMGDMETMMKGAGDPTAKSRMQAMHNRMSAMMANMQKMHGGMTPVPGAPEPPAATASNEERQDQEEHRPGP